MQLFLHYDSFPDLTYLVIVDDPAKQTVHWLLDGFLKAYLKTHSDKTHSFPTFVNGLILSKQRTPSSKALAPSDLISSIAKDKDDLFVRIDPSATPVAPKPVEMPIPQTTKPKKVTAAKPQLSAEEKSALEQLIVQSMKAQNFVQTREICAQLLTVENNNLMAHFALAEIATYLGDHTTASNELEACLRVSPADPMLLMKLGDAFLADGEFEDALKTYQKGLGFCETNPTEASNFEIGIANTLVASGRNLDTAQQVLANILKKNDNHQAALLAYVQLLISKDLEHEEQIRVMLRLVAQNQNSPKIKSLIYKVMCYPASVQFVLSVIPLQPDVSSVYSYLGGLMRDNSRIDLAIEMFQCAHQADRTVPAYSLSLAHAHELNMTGELVFKSIVEFIRDNRQMSVGGLKGETVMEILEALCYPDQSLSHAAVLDVEFPVRPARQQKSLTESSGGTKPPYNQTQLDLLALFQTATKVAFVNGQLNACAKLINLIRPIHQDFDYFNTSIRNENAYYGCVEDLLPLVPKEIPSEPLPTLYVVGDSHCLSLAWQRIKFQNKLHVIKPLLVTGCKLWHLRPESTFYPKYNFYKAVESIPEGSPVIFLFGEIDCRDGILRAVEKCRHKNVNEAFQHIIKLYIKIIRQVAQDKKLTAFVHPALPVMDVTRALVMQFNDLMPMFVGMNRNPKWLNFVSNVLDPVTRQLKPEYVLDGTHIHPSYLPLVENALGTAQ